METHSRKTKAKSAILLFLENSPKPVDALEVKKHLDRNKIRVNLTTVYRAMESFLEEGLIVKVEFHEGKYRYEISSRKHHHHLVCQNCGRVEDIEDCLRDDLAKKVFRKSGFLIKSHSLEFYGICKDCQ